jgi:ABC-2 type transport system permease protein
MTAAPDLVMAGGMRQFERQAGALTPPQRAAVDAWLPRLKAGAASATDGSGGSAMGLAVEVVDLMRTDDRRGSLISFYAAGIGVMFLLFSMAGAGGFLLEQEEIGALERLLTANLGMTTLLLGSWLFFALIGMAQLALMFLFAAAIFRLELFTLNHLAGSAIMIVVTALAASAFAMILATLSRSRAQLGGMSTIIILIMSALGGSMVPRFVAPGVFEKTAPFTFNGWALDGFLNVFWYDDPAHSLTQALATIALPATVLAGMAAAFLVIARVLARRWEAA